jgi:radical SAM superfamily enzyme YgiQ (UPF0313 family)
MNIVIFTPGHPSHRKKSFPPALAAPYLAALATPYAKKIKIIDLAVQSFDFSAPMPDLALFTTTMAQADQVFEFAGHLKNRGVKTILGGPYASLAHNFDPRISEIFDTVVVGEGEKALPQILQDFKKGQLKPTYAMPISSLDGVPFSRLDLLDHRKYMSTTALIGTRGCVHQCEYCSIRDIYGQKYLKRPVDEVIEEIKFQTARPNLQWLDRKLVQFWDDNPAADLDWFHNLLEKLIPLKKWWLSQMCLNVADNTETVKLMKASGCRGIFIGLESINSEILQAQRKEKINIIDNYKQQCRTLLKHRLCVVGAIMFGFDEDRKETTFGHTLKFIEDMGLTLLNDLIVTPYPHMDYYRKLVKEGRLITREAKYYNGYTVVHRPLNMKAADLQKEVLQFRSRFYSWPSILRRIKKHHIAKIPEFLVWNTMWGKNNQAVIPGVNVDKWLAHLKAIDS